MGRLKGKDIDEVMNLIQLCPASPDTGENVNRFFQETQKIFDSDELVFLYPNPRTSGIDLKRSFSLKHKNKFLSRYADFFWRYDPLYDAELSSEHNTLAFRTQDVLPYNHFIKLKFFSDFLEPQDLSCELVIRLFFKSYFFGAISLLRSKNKPLFDKSDIRKAELLVPYIVNTIDDGDYFARSFEEQKLFEQWLESQSEGIIFLDSEFRTLYFNSKAHLYCSLLAGKRTTTTPGAAFANLMIPDVCIQDCKCLARSQHGMNNTPGYDNRIVNSAHRTRYHIQYFTFTTAAAENARPSFIIIINDLSRYSGNTEEIILNQAKLSNRESIVARYAGLGWTNKEIADSIHSSPFTIQNQLKKVFEKTGLKNRTQLANLMKYSDSVPEDK